MSSKERILVPTYHMETQDYYLLLKIMMSLSNKKNVNGLRESFFSEITEKSQKDSLKRLSKNRIITMTDSEIMLSDAVREQIVTVLESNFCLCFNNEELKKNHTVLTFYYADGFFAAVMSDEKRTTIARSNTVDGIMHPFEKKLLKAGMSSTFDLEKWKELAREKFAEPITKPNRSCVLAIGSNKDMREVYSVTMLADKDRLQILRGEDSVSVRDSFCETVSSKDYYGVIYHEIERLKSENENHRINEKREEQVKKQTKEKTDYERIIETEGFPRSGIGFIFYTLFHSLKSIPMMIKYLIRKKMVSFWAMLLWSVFLFLYNMYGTCYMNDTFIFDRRAMWGNFTPYLFAGQIRTPCDLYGFNLDRGNINTVFLAGSLFLVITYLLRHIITHIKARKLAFFSDVATVLPKLVSKQVHREFSLKKDWIICAVVFLLSFILKNPITILILGVLFLMISSQGRENMLVRFVMTASCAFSRKRVEEGKRKPPTLTGVSEDMGVLGEAFLIYSVVNVFLWYLCHYNSYMRLIITMVLVLFCIFQIIVTNKKMPQATAIIFFVVSTFMLISSQVGIVFADDGGISESGGTLEGLMQNAGFGLIVGMSLAAILIAALGTVAIPVIIGGALGGALFTAGLTDTGAGDYVRKSSKQYFEGPEKGDKYTHLCVGAKVLDLISSFVSPKGAANGTMLAFKGLSVGKGVISTAGDADNLVDHTIDFSKGEGNVSDIVDDVIGLGFDVYGLKGDIGDVSEISKLAKVNGKKDIYEASDLSFGEMATMKKQTIADADNNYLKQESAEMIRSQQKKSSICDDLDGVMADRSLSDVERTTKENILSESLKTESNIHAENMQGIRDTQQSAIDEANKIYKKQVLDKSADIAADTYQLHTTGKELNEDFVQPTEETNSTPRAVDTISEKLTKPTDTRKNL